MSVVTKCQCVCLRSRLTCCLIIRTELLKQDTALACGLLDYKEHSFFKGLGVFQAGLQAVKLLPVEPSESQFV